MKEGYDTTLDLDVLNCAQDINTRQEDGESLIYARYEDGKVSLVFSGFDEDLINLIISCMYSDELFRDNVMAAVGLYLEDDGS